MDTNRRDEQVNLIYNRIGRFVVEYSQLVGKLKLLVAHIANSGS